MPLARLFSALLREDRTIINQFLTMSEFDDFFAEDEEQAVVLDDAADDLIGKDVADTDVADSTVVGDGWENLLLGGTRDADEDYRAAIRGGRIVYTCNAGWIDVTHAFTDTQRKRLGVGTQSLWNQITTQSGYKSESPGENGFLVVCRQDARVVSLLPTIGITRKYFVQYGLPVARQEEIAMAIFQEVSLEFEDFQGYGAVIGKGASSFEPADLISNLLSFYRIVRPAMTKARLLQLCVNLTVNQSLDILRLYPGTFTDEKYKNRKFTPRYFANRYCTNPTFPAELQSIKPAVKGKDFRDWNELLDVYAGKPPMNGPKY